MAPGRTGRRLMPDSIDMEEPNGHRRAFLNGKWERRCGALIKTCLPHASVDEREEAVENHLVGVEIWNRWEEDESADMLTFMSSFTSS